MTTKPLNLDELLRRYDGLKTMSNIMTASAVAATRLEEPALNQLRSYASVLVQSAEDRQAQLDVINALLRLVVAVNENRTEEV